METEADKPEDRPGPSRNRVAESDLNFDRPPKPISELLAIPEFPKSALGEFVDIGGYTGVVAEIVNQSIKVRSPEGGTKSFNVHGLRRIYGPRPSLPTQTSSVPPPPPREELKPVEPEIVVPKALSVLQPDFEKPVKKMIEFIGRPDYPECVLGEHVDINGYTGVVVQIVNRSLKVRSRAEITRSYNADALRKVYGA